MASTLQAVRSIWRASTAITAGSAPFSGFYRPEEALSAFDGLDPNGLWTLEITDDASGDTGTLVSWSLEITYGDPSAVTDGSGRYTISHIAAGNYVVRDELPAGWVHISPASGAQNRWSTIRSANSRYSGDRLQKTSPSPVAGRT